MGRRTGNPSSLLTSTSRTAGCGPACPVVWEGRAGDCSPYPDRPSSRPLMCCRFAPDLVWPTRRANSLESCASYIWDAVYDCTCRYAPGHINGPRGRDLRRDSARLTPHIEAHHAEPHPSRRPPHRADRPGREPLATASAATPPNAVLEALDGGSAAG